VKVAFHVTNSRPEDGLPSPAAVDRTVHPEEVEEMRAVLRQKIPDMNGELLRSTTCMYTSTVDGHL
jgi:sarcosine oxidase